MSRASTALRVVSNDAIDAEPQPHDAHAERVVLGAVMSSPAAFPEVEKLVSASDFYLPAHQVIWEAIAALADRGDPCEPVAVYNYLGPKAVARCGGAEYLHTLVAAVPVAANAVYYAHIVRGLAYNRAVIETSAELTTAAWTASGDESADLRGTVAAKLAALSETSLRGWPEPIPLSDAPEVPPFPMWTLPEWVGEFAACVAEATQTPPDLAGCLALAVLAVAASGKIRIAPTGDVNGWKEPACLYTVVVLPPGNRKSEVYRLMTGPLSSVERTLIDIAKPQIAEAVIRRRIAESRAETTARDAETAAAKSDDSEKAATLAAATKASLELENSEIPALPCLFSEDTTVEALGSMIADQGGRFAVLSPEGEIFSIAAGRYSRDPNLGILKKAHAGEGDRVNRKGRPAEYIESANLTIGVCIQPGVLNRLGETPEFREQGFLARFLYSVPESLLGYRKPDPDPVPDSIRERYAATLTAFALALNALEEVRTLTFSPEAAEAVTALLGDTEPRFRPDGDLGHMTDWGGKLVGAVVRIAGLLHLAEHGLGGCDVPVSLASFEAAKEIGGYYTEHAKAAYDAIGANPATAKARVILNWLRTTGTSQFTGRDLMRSMRKEFRAAKELNEPIAMLETRGWIRRRPSARPGPGGGRPSPSWEVYPGIADES